MTDREKMIDLIINAKRSDPETGSFTEYLADFLLGYGVKLPDSRPISREQVEKVWRGEWKMEEAQEFRCSVCGAKITYYGHPDKFCADCGSAMTDEAVQMVMERMEKLYEQTSN